MLILTLMHCDRDFNSLLCVCQCMYILPASSCGVGARVLSLNAVFFCTFSRTSLMII